MRNTITRNRQAALDVFTTQWFAALAEKLQSLLETPLLKFSHQTESYMTEIESKKLSHKIHFN